MIPPTQRKMRGATQQKERKAQPTREKLLQTALSLLETHFPEDVTGDMLLEHSGVLPSFRRCVRSSGTGVSQQVFSASGHEHHSVVAYDKDVPFSRRYVSQVVRRNKSDAIA